MRVILYSTLRVFFAGFLLTNLGSAQESFSVRSFPLPGAFNHISSLLIDPVGKPQVPLLGGVYAPSDSVWFMPPRPERHITSYASFPDDTALMILSNTDKNSLIDWMKYKSAGSIIRVPLVTMPLGIYQFTQKDNRLLVWGITQEGSHIGVLLKNKMRWLLHTQKLIRQVQFNSNGNVCFATDSMIFNYTTKEKILANTSPIYGFDFDSDGRIYLTTQEGFGYIEKNKMVILSSEVKGYVCCYADRIYVQPLSGDQLFEFTRYRK